jgi:hypothetical protein
LKQHFEDLAEEQGLAKSMLLDEAISDIVRKFEHPEANAATPARIAALEAEVQQLQQRLAVEERFRTDIEVHHFKNRLRTHDQPQDSDFAKRFLIDTRLPSMPHDRFMRPNYGPIITQQRISTCLKRCGKICCLPNFENTGHLERIDQ